MFCHFPLRKRSTSSRFQSDESRSDSLVIGVTKVSHVEDAVKAMNVSLTDEETAGLEKLADSLEINAIRFWEKEMK